MSFKSVLKTIEEDALKGIAIYSKVQGFEPIANGLIAAVSPKVADVARSAESKADVTITDLKNIATTVQFVGTQPGSLLTDDQKLAQEAALAGQLLQTFGHITDKNVGNASEVAAGVEDLMRAIVRIQNGLIHKP